MTIIHCTKDSECVASCTDTTSIGLCGRRQQQTVPFRPTEAGQKNGRFVVQIARVLCAQYIQPLRHRERDGQTSHAAAVLAAQERLHVVAASAKGEKEIERERKLISTIYIFKALMLYKHAHDQAQFVSLSIFLLNFKFIKKF